jgi:hypothetical protein
LWQVAALSFLWQVAARSLQNVGTIVCTVGGRESVHVLIIWKCRTHFDYVRYCVHVCTKWCWANLILVGTCSLTFLPYMKMKSIFFSRETVYNTKYWWAWKSIRFGTFILTLFLPVQFSRFVCENDNEFSSSIKVGNL